MRQNLIQSEGGLALREAICDHGMLTKAALENNVVNLRDIEEIHKACRRNKERGNDQKIPRFKNELQYLIITNKKKELEETMKLVSQARENKDQIHERIG